MAIFEGAGVALVTPFKENGTVNYEVLESLIEEQIAAGTDCIVAMGTTGESATTSEEEHIQVIRFVCEVVNGRIPVVAGTGSNCTQTAVELSVEAEEAGAGGVLLVSPYYNKATQNGLKAHFTKIANSIKIPAILYNVPSRTGVNIAPETIVDLCRHVENIVGVKEASGNFSAAAKILQLSGGYVEGRVRLGITGSDISATQAAFYGVPRGFMIVSIDEDSAFAGTEAQPEDIITAIDGETVEELQDISNLLLRYSPGDQVTVTLYRPPVNGMGEGEELEVTITLLEDKGETQR